ncbi:uncharacterized protein VP01_109g2 [Puccinia sorghi]|uniref:Uncharacterized protein n=1 Tax=Puccinia sorghi TaxID=27349 RepID=A0A0L6VSW9_9BASI|nr:uncharacterized protein VP01_109g2 [Puccinia sorghi]
MVNTRRNRPKLSGPLPPATRPKRPTQTKQYKDLLKLPPLPPSPELLSSSPKERQVLMLEIKSPPKSLGTYTNVIKQCVRCQRTW